MTKAEHSLIFGYPKTKALSISALFAVLLSVSSIIIIPIPFSPVPITLQVMIVYLIVAILGPFLGSFACGVYLILGAIGLPVFAGASSGMAVLIGPTGGYLFGFLLGSFLGGLVCRRRSSAKRIDLLKVCVAFAITLTAIYLVGIFWLAIYLHLSMQQAFLLGAVPFLPVDAAKALVAVPIAMQVRWLPLSLPIVRASAVPPRQDAH
jgi:biotin transport system substrate-specific component